MHPFIGGRLEKVPSDSATSLLAFEISQVREWTLHPNFVRLFTISTFSGVDADERDRNIRFIAPRDAIHLARLRPRPPYPPART